MGIADFLILDRRMPRSLAFCDDQDRDNLTYLAEDYGERHPCHDHIDVLTCAACDTMTIERVFEDGLHEFITDFRDRHRAARRTDRKGLPVLRLGTRRTDAPEDPTPRPIITTTRALRAAAAAPDPKSRAGQTVQSWDIQMSRAAASSSSMTTITTIMSTLVSFDDGTHRDQHALRGRGRERRPARRCRQAWRLRAALAVPAARPR
jgi:hypothetical protein